jgi:hypothetical protein
MYNLTAMWEVQREHPADKLKDIFASIDAKDGHKDSYVSRDVLRAKIKADVGLERVLGQKRDLDGIGFLAVIRVSALLVSMDSSSEDWITYNEFKNAVAMAAAKAIFDDLAGRGMTVSLDHFHSKLRRDGELVRLMGTVDRGRGAVGCLKMESLLVRPETDETGSVTWEAYAAAVQDAMVMTAIKRTFDKIAVEMAAGTATLVGRATRISRDELLQRLKADGELAKLLDRKDLSGRPFVGCRVRIDTVLVEVDTNYDKLVSLKELTAWNSALAGRSRSPSPGPSPGP